MDAKMDICARNRTLSHMRTNEAWIRKRNCALFIVYIYICPYSRDTVISLVSIHIYVMARNVD